jgi:phage FluMu gp28-like protein
MKLRISIIFSAMLLIAGCAMAELAIPAPIIRFDPSQQRFFRDPARVIAVNFHRQKGKDFVAAGKAIDGAAETAQDWFIVGLTQAQADETFNKCKRFVSAMKELLKRKFGTDRVDEESERFTDYDKEIEQAFECTARILRLPNGARVVSLPGKNPDALAGRTGNLILTEFGLYPKGGYEHWGTLFPITTRGGFKLLAISTPRGKNTKFYELCQNEGGFYSVHFCDIYKSVFEDGYQLYDALGKPFPQATREQQELAIATFRKIYNDESKWPREYECQFTGDLSSLITWAEIERAAALGSGMPFDVVEFTGEKPVGDLLLHLRNEVDAGARVEVGWDVARKKDISSIWVNLARLNKPKHLRFNVLMHKARFETQRLFVRAVMDLQRWSVGHGDATGMGMDSNETLAQLYKDRWTPFTFTAPGKREIASALKTAFVDGTQTIPALSGTTKYVGTDLYAIQKDDTGANFTLDEMQNPLLPDSHCDVAYSGGLARVAGASLVRIPMRSEQLKPVGW